MRKGQIPKDILFRHYDKLLENKYPLLVNRGPANII